MQYFTVSVVTIEIFKVWNDKAPMPLHHIWSFGTVGQIIGVFIAGPFLSPVNTGNSSYNSSSVIMNNSYNSTNMMTKEISSHIQWPFIIIGIIIVLTGILSIAVSKGVSMEFENSKHSKSGVSKCCSFGIQNQDIHFWLLVISLFLVQMAISAKDVSITFGIMPVAIDLQMTKREGALVSLLHLLGRAGGKMILGLLTRIISIRTYSIMCILMSLLLLVILTVWGVDNSTLFYVTLPCHSVFSSADTPAAYSLSDRYTKITGYIVAFTEIGKSLGCLEALALNGYILDHFGGRGVLVECIGWSILIVCGYISIICIGYKLGDRFESHEVDINADERPLLEKEDHLQSENIN